MFLDNEMKLAHGILTNDFNLGNNVILIIFAN